MNGNAQIATAASGLIVGYDPGGDGRHGLAILVVERACEIWLPRAAEVKTFATLESVLVHVERSVQDEVLLAVSVDALTCWSTGRCGWRPADRWLRGQYPRVANSVVSPNSLFGSMAGNGAACVHQLAAQWPEAMISETHPKVCYHAMTGKIHKWSDQRDAMCAWLLAELGISASLSLANEHEFDALFSCLAVLRGLNGQWTMNLHALLPDAGERLVPLGGLPVFWWVGANNDHQGAAATSSVAAAPYG